MSLFDLALLTWRRRWLIGAVVFVFGAAAVAVALVMPPIYRAEALLVPVERQDSLGGLSSLIGQFGGLASLAGVSVSGDDQTAEAIAVLQSRSLTEQFIRDKNLLPTLFPRAWDAARGTWRNADQQPTMGDALLLFGEQIRSVRPDLQSGLVTLRIDWRDRELAAQWANELVGRANELLRQRAIAEAENSLEYLGRALEEANNVELRSAISTLMQSQMQTRTFANVRPEYAFRIVDPAIASDPDKRVRPRRTLMVLAGLLAGVLAGIMLAAFLEHLRTARSAPARRE